jgi:peptidoglycan/LPS O-acetylase OafA/YrhL
MRRICELDSLRGLAALAIVIYHFKTSWLPFGWGAVDLFFVLSGYLITTIILTNGRAEGFLTSFYVRRGLRIWPIYYLSLLALVVLGPLLPRPNNYAGFLNYLTYTQYTPHYWGGTVEDFTWYLKHTWTLAIEEQFYLLWPPLVLLVGRRGLPFLALSVAAASVAARGSGFHWWILAGRCDGFALGGLLAWLLLDGPWVARHLKSVRIGFSTIGLMALSVLTLIGLTEGLPDHGPPRSPAVTILALNLLFTATVGLVVAHAGCPRLAPLRGPILGYLGTISYGLYLYHMIILRIKLDYAQRHGLGRAAGLDLLALVASFALAVASWHLIERPLLRLKDRFAYRRSARDIPPQEAIPPGRIDPTQSPRPIHRTARDRQRQQTAAIGEDHRGGRASSA